MSKKENCCCSDRLGKVGGQAVLEGVMMKAGERTVTTCRKEDGSIVVSDGRFVSVRSKHKILDLPIIRGVVNFVEMMILSFKTLSISAEALDLDDDKDKKKKAEGKKTTTDLVMIIGAVLGVLLAVGLFMVLPGYTSELCEYLIKRIFDYQINETVKAITEGVAKIIIFVSYLCLVSLMSDIKRTFMYHGAEHKSIACFESGEDLTPENAMKHTRFHPRCGTSFMFVMILLGIIVGIVVNNIFTSLPRYAIIAIRLLILPIVVGLGYEFIRFAGRHNNIITRIFSAPGLWMQRITTKEPTEDMLEIAIISLKCSLRDDYPEFKEFYELKSWEKKADEQESSNEEGAATDEVEEANNTSAENEATEVNNNTAACELAESDVPEKTEEQQTKNSGTDEANDAT